MSSKFASDVKYYQVGTHDDSDNVDVKTSNYDNDSTSAYVDDTAVLKRQYSYNVYFIAVITFASLLILFVITLSTAGSSISNAFSNHSGSSSNDDDNSIDNYSITMKVYNPKYGSNEIDSVADLPWDHIHEPHKLTSYHLTSMTNTDDDTSIDFSDDDILVEWSIDGESHYGSVVNTTVAKSGCLISCTLTITSTKNNNVLYSNTFDVAMKYVRREIRSLHDEDLTAWIDAMATMYTTDSVTGIEKYGSKYTSAEALLYKHLNGAARSDCDHWHDGAGIVTHHMAYTLEAEQSLQAINPELSMPYWEYAMDTYLYDNWYDSDVFSPSILGEAIGKNADKSISSGVWSGVALPDGSDYTDWDMSVEGVLNPFINAYGVMRSPWNNNPSNYIGRHNLTYSKSTEDALPYPTCSTMYYCYSSSTLAEMHDCLNGNTHGPVHIYIGGTWGEESTLWDDVDVQFLAGIDKLLYFKMLWRSGFTRCPTACTDEKDADNDICMCSVPDEYISTYGATYMLQQAGIYDMITNELGNDADGTIALKVLRAVEDPGVVGEMFSSGAAYDPSFWPLHGQIDRMVGLKRINVANGDISDFDETWGYTTNNYKFLVGNCDWSNVSSNDDLTLPVCDMDSSYVCSGHNEYDVLEFTNFTGSSETYTNRAFYDFIHPNNVELPYVYDNYQFDYCSEYDSFVF